MMKKSQEAKRMRKREKKKTTTVKKEKLTVENLRRVSKYVRIICFFLK
jgi:hypothetical protein